MAAVTPSALAFVFVAGLITALATGLGALPFFLFDDISDRWNVVLWGLASGIMLAASGFGLVAEGLAASDGLPVLLAAGVGAGIALVVVADSGEGYSTPSDARTGIESVKANAPGAEVRRID